MPYIVTYPVNREQDSYWIIAKLEDLPQMIADEVGWRTYELEHTCEAKDIRITGIYEIGTGIAVPPAALEEAQKLVEAEILEREAERKKRQEERDRRQLEALKLKLGEK